MDIKEEKVCERFKEIRNSLKMKQADFAKEIKLTQGHNKIYPVWVLFIALLFTAFAVYDRLG